jgi:hypothetical protein
MDKSELRICADCKFFDPNGHERKKYVFFGPMVTTDFQFAKCSHPAHCNKVSGKGGRYCDFIRSNYSVYECGAEGKLWEPK